MMLLGIILFTSFSDDSAFAEEVKSENNDDASLLDAAKCESLISIPQVQSITGLESENIHFRVITEDLTHLNNPTMTSGCAFGFESQEGTVSIGLMVAQYMTSEDVIEKIDIAMQGAQTKDVSIEEGVSDDGWNYVTMEINDAGLGIMMNSYKENLSITFNVPLTGGEQQPVSIEHLKEMSGIVQSSLETGDDNDAVMMTQTEKPEETEDTANITNQPLSFYGKGIITGEHFNGGVIWMAVKGDTMRYIVQWENSKAKIISTVTQSSECKPTFQICLDGKVTDNDQGGGLEVGDTQLTKIDPINKRQKMNSKNKKLA